MCRHSPVQHSRGAGLRPALLQRPPHISGVESEPAQPLCEPLDSPRVAHGIWQRFPARSAVCRDSMLGRCCRAVATERGEGAFDRRPLLLRHDQADWLPASLSCAHQSASYLLVFQHRPSAKLQGLPGVTEQATVCVPKTGAATTLPDIKGCKELHASAVRRALSRSRRASSAAARAASRAFFLSACAVTAPDPYCQPQAAMRRVWPLMLWCRHYMTF